MINRIPKKNQRLLMFDLMRVTAIILVVIWHIATTYQISPFNFMQIYYGMLEVDIGAVGVSIFVFISGSLLQYTYKDITSWNDLFTFYKKRLLRIYPILWVSLIMIIIVQKWVLTSFSPFEILFSFTGLSLLFHIKGMESWFICCIVVLYILFPLISYCIKKKPYLSIISIIIFSLCLRYVLYMLFFGKDAWLSAAYHWFPLSSMLEFGLGIFIVRQGIFPKIYHQNSIITFLSELCFPVFLVHGIVKDSYANSPLLFVFETMFLAVILYIIDVQLQSAIDEAIISLSQKLKKSAGQIKVICKIK